MKNPKPGSNAAAATPQDVPASPGRTDDATLAAIMALSPTLAEVEAAALWARWARVSRCPNAISPAGCGSHPDLIAVDEDEERRISSRILPYSTG